VAPPSPRPPESSATAWFWVPAHTRGWKKQRKPQARASKSSSFLRPGRCTWVDDHVRRAIDHGYDAFCFTIDTDSHSRRERDIAKRHQRRRARLSASDEQARIYQARFSWRDIERIKKNFDIPVVLKGIGTAKDAKIARMRGRLRLRVEPMADASSIRASDRSMSYPRSSKQSAAAPASWSMAASTAAPMWSRRWSSAPMLYISGLAAAGGPGVVRLFEILEDEIRICLSRAIVRKADAISCRRRFGRSAAATIGRSAVIINYSCSVAGAFSRRFPGNSWRSKAILLL
jgi:FMN-dependent dehydrogenase